MLSLLGCIPNDLDRLDALVMLAAPVQNPHLVKVWDIVQFHGVLVCHYNLRMSTKVQTLQILCLEHLQGFSITCF